MIVNNTSIFAREAEGDSQHLIYSKRVKAKAAVAMVLPLPVPKGTGETDVSFIDLSGYPEIFADLFNMMGFFRDAPKSATEHPVASAPAPLAVQDVGAFEASFVPTVVDFARLDERFRLPAGTWDKLPTYRDYGFAVFKLKPGEEKVHPMAFTFPRANRSSLFFPTVHIHDGQVHDQAEFDHFLYAQTGERHFLRAEEWKESVGLAWKGIDVRRAKGTVAEEQHVYCSQLRGKLPNQDTLLKFG